MDETPGMIRQQMEETKSQLTEKLETLELQVAETVQTTGTAVTATVEAVHETVDSVTDAVHDAVRTISDVFDFRRHVEEHPWLVLGGAVIAGYALAGMFKEPPQPAARRNARNALPARPADDFVGVNGAAPSPRAASSAAAYESGRERSAWDQLKVMAISAAVTMAQSAASGALPHLIGFLTGESGSQGRSNRVDKIRGRPRRNVTPDVPGYPQLASIENPRSRKSR